MQVQTTYSRLYKNIVNIQVTIVFLTAIGMLYGNILFGRLSTYPLSLPFIFTIIFYVLSIPSWLQNNSKIRSPFFLLALLLLSYQFIVHGWIRGGAYNTEWLQSFALLAFYAGVFIIGGTLYISKDCLYGVGRVLVWSLLLMGGLGFTQFIAANSIGLIIQPLPEELSLRVVDLGRDSLRFGGIIRSTGLAYEPSFYGTGIVVALTLYYILVDWFPDILKTIRYKRPAILLGFAGAISSLSLAAWGILGTILIFRQVLKVGSKQILQSVAGFLSLFLTVLLLWPRLQTRWTFGNDYSLIHRVWSSVELIVAPGEDLVASLLGTGIGLDAQSAKVWSVIARNFSLDVIRYYQTENISLELVNGFSYIAVSSGWVGLAITIAIIFATFRFSLKAALSHMYVLALLVGYFFTNGRYLWPEWWFLLLGVMNLYQLRFSDDINHEETAKTACLPGSQQLYSTPR